jgi:hypothetical protein
MRSRRASRLTPDDGNALTLTGAGQTSDITSEDVTREAPDTLNAAKTLLQTPSRANIYGRAITLMW